MTDSPMSVHFFLGFLVVMIGMVAFTTYTLSKP